MADAEPDGMNEAVEGALRIGLTVAGRMGEVLAREHERAQRAAEAGDEQQTRELAARFGGERAAVRAELAPIHRDDWWQSAQHDQINQAWMHAVEWRHRDPEVDRAAGRMEHQLQARYGIDVRDLPAGGRALAGELERRDVRANSAPDRDTATRDRHEAALLMRDAGAVSAEQPTEAQADRTLADGLYGDAERHDDAAAGLEGIDDRESVEARVLADTHQARPAREAVTTQSSRAPKARSARGSARAPERVRGR